MDALEWADDASADAAAARPEPARDDQGRFAAAAQDQAAPEGEAAAPAAAAEADAGAQPAPQSEPTTSDDVPVEETAKPGYVPLVALLETRDKARQAEEKARAAEERLAALEAAKPAAPRVPDRYADPDAYDDWLQGQLIAQNRELQLDVQALRAEQKHGPELVKAAREWGFQKCAEDPHFNQRMWGSSDPIGDVIAEYQKAQALSALSDPATLEAFRAWQAGQSAAPAQPNNSAPEPQSPPPPRSLASRPAAGSAKPGEQPVGAGVAFDAVFS